MIDARSALLSTAGGMHLPHPVMAAYVMGAAAAGIVLAMLEVVARSRSDTRGLLGMLDADGAPVNAAPLSHRFW